MTTPNPDAQAVEKLAAIEYDQWIAWATRLLDTEKISEDRRLRWSCYMVPYDKLPDDVQEHDRVWARKILAAIRAGEVPGIVVQPADRQCHICGKTVVPVDQTVRFPSCQCHIDLVVLRSQLAKATRSLESASFTDLGGELWKPPLGKRPPFEEIDDLRAQLAAVRERDDFSELTGSFPDDFKSFRDFFDYVQTDAAKAWAGLDLVMKERDAAIAERDALLKDKRWTKQAEADIDEARDLFVAAGAAESYDGNYTVSFLPQCARQIIAERDAALQMARENDIDGACISLCRDMLKRAGVTEFAFFDDNVAQVIALWKRAEAERDGARAALVECLPALNAYIAENPAWMYRQGGSGWIQDPNGAIAIRDQIKALTSPQVGGGEGT